MFFHVVSLREAGGKNGRDFPRREKKAPSRVKERRRTDSARGVTAALTFPLGSAVGARLCGRDAGRVRRAGAASRRGMNPPEGQIHDNHGKDSMQARPSRAFRMSGNAPWNEHVMADTKYNRNDTSDACSKLCVPRRLRGDFLFFVTGMIHIQ
ncbi:MAG: hypothetical protein DBY37_06580 [Desulfovibrionaceae bacterium]|nr:MAG: hypothetical protein DBY37_06580 [Desulfovibrionaceae bacterium]